MQMVRPYHSQMKVLLTHGEGVQHRRPEPTVETRETFFLEDTVQYMAYREVVLPLPFRIRWQSLDTSFGAEMEFSLKSKNMVITRTHLGGKRR